MAGQRGEPADRASRRNRRGLADQAIQSRTRQLGETMRRYRGVRSLVACRADSDSVRTSRSPALVTSFVTSRRRR